VSYQIRVIPENRT